MSSRPESFRLNDIIENIDAIQEYVLGMSIISFQNDRRTLDAVERCLQRITEAAIRIGETRMEEIAPNVPFHQVRGLGNALRHEYHRIDAGSIFLLLSDELPALRSACVSALDSQ
jgi:uncharacterized protein with HEPN domain